MNICVFGGGGTEGKGTERRPNPATHILHYYNLVLLCSHSCILKTQTCAQINGCKTKPKPNTRAHTHSQSKINKNRNNATHSKLQIWIQWSSTYGEKESIVIHAAAQN